MNLIQSVKWLRKRDYIFRRAEDNSNWKILAKKKETDEEIKVKLCVKGGE